MIHPSEKQKTLISWDLHGWHLYEVTNSSSINKGFEHSATAPKISNYIPIISLMLLAQNLKNIMIASISHGQSVIVHNLKLSSLDIFCPFVLSLSIATKTMMKVSMGTIFPESNHPLISDYPIIIWWLSHPSEKYERQLGRCNSQYMKDKNWCSKLWGLLLLWKLMGFPFMGPKMDGFEWKSETKIDDLGVPLWLRKLPFPFSNTLSRPRTPGRSPLCWSSLSCCSGEQRQFATMGISWDTVGK